MRIFILLLCFSVTLSGCSSLDSLPFMGEDEATETNETDTPTQETDRQLYDAGLANLDASLYRTAIIDFEEIERLYPFSKLATQAQIMIAYALYRDEQYDEAITLIDRFTKLHPAHRDVAYMYYLKAMSYYERIADVKRDQKITLQALDALSEVIRRYPDNQYGRDAQLKKDLVVDHLAGKEMEIGRFYLERRQFVGAMNRFQKVINEYQTTNHIEEALYRMVEANLSLGLNDEAKKYAAVLGKNYPSSKWYNYAYRLVAIGENAPKPQEDPKWYESISIPFINPSESHTPSSIEKDDKAESWLERVKEIF